MRGFKIVILFLANLLIDLAIISKYQIFGVVPSITIPLIVVLSMFSDRENIVYYAVIQGMFQDVAFGKILGVSALIFYLISYYTYETDIKKNFNLWYGLSCTFLGVNFSIISHVVVGFLFDKSMSLSMSSLIYGLIAQVIISVIIYIIIYFIFYYFRKKRLRNYI